MEKKMSRFLALLLLAGLLGGCSVVAIRKHEPGYKNVRALQSQKASFRLSGVRGRDEYVERSLSSKSLLCRLTTFNMPAGQTVADYIRQALTDELDAAQRLSMGGTVLEITVLRLDSNSLSPMQGAWDLEFEYSYAGRRRKIKTVYKFESAIDGQVACRNTAQAFSDALAQNFAEFYKSLGPAGKKSAK